MLSVIIPTLQASETLAETASCLLSATVEGLIKEVIIVDGGSTDDTVRIADELGAKIIHHEPGRGQQLHAGGRDAQADWLLFLHADTVLADGWATKVARFIEKAPINHAAYFRFAFDDASLSAKLIAAGVHLRCALFGLPYGDQGLLISRAFYTRLGGYAAMELMEDVDLISRLKKAGSLTMLQAEAITAATRYRKDGYLRRVIKNMRCLLAWKRGVSLTKIKEMYE